MSEYSPDQLADLVAEYQARVDVIKEYGSIDVTGTLLKTAGVAALAGTIVGGVNLSRGQEGGGHEASVAPEIHSTFKPEAPQTITIEATPAATSPVLPGDDPTPMVRHYEEFFPQAVRVPEKVYPPSRRQIFHFRGGLSLNMQPETTAPVKHATPSTTQPRKEATSTTTSAPESITKAEPTTTTTQPTKETTTTTSRPEESTTTTVPDYVKQLHPSNAGRDSIAVIGDSITLGQINEGGLNSLLEQKGFQVSQVNEEATVGDNVADAEAKIAANHQLVANVGTILVELGTNNCALYSIPVCESTAEFETQIKNLVTLIRSINPNANIYWNNIYSTKSDVYKSIDTAIDQESFSLNFWPIDTADYEIDNPSLFSFDPEMGVHQLTAERLCQSCSLRSQQIEYTRSDSS